MNQRPPEDADPPNRLAGNVSGQSRSRCPGKVLSEDGEWPICRLEAHYFRNVRYQPDTMLLDRVDRLRSIPAFAVHGRYDLVCPIKNLDDLCHAWPELDAVIVPDAGHSAHEPGITRELVTATARIAETGSPVR